LAQCAALRETINWCRNKWTTKQLLRIAPDGQREQRVWLATGPIALAQQDHVTLQVTGGLIVIAEETRDVGVRNFKKITLYYVQTLFIISCTLGKKREKQHAHNLFRGVAPDCISVCLYASCLYLHYLGTSSASTERALFVLIPFRLYKTLTPSIRNEYPTASPTCVCFCVWMRKQCSLAHSPLLHHKSCSIFIYFRLRVIENFRCLLKLCLVTDLTIIVIAEPKGSANLPIRTRSWTIFFNFQS
jgi:hypothetical protein